MSLLILAALYSVSVVYSKYILRGIKYNCFFSGDEVFENDEITFTEELSNVKLLPVPWLKTEIAVSKFLEFPEQQSTVTRENARLVTSFFSPGSMCRIKRVWKVKCLRRGNFSVENIRIVASDVLGITVASFIPEGMTGPLSVRVLPSPHEIPFSHTDMSILNGDTVVRNKLIKDEFFINGIREYVPGDRLAGINWYATAHEAKLMVNSYDCTDSCSVTVILIMNSGIHDIFETSDTEKLEVCIKTSAFLIEHEASQGRNVRFAANTRINGENADFTSSDPLQLLEVLADIKTEISEGFETFLENIIPSAADSSVFIVSMFSNDTISSYSQRDPSVKIIVHTSQEGGQI